MGVQVLTADARAITNVTLVALLVLVTMALSAHDEDDAVGFFHKSWCLFTMSNNV
jgi:hypothetical protein